MRFFYSRYIPISVWSFIGIGVGGTPQELEEKKRIIIIIIISRRNTVRSSHGMGKTLINSVVVIGYPKLFGEGFKLLWLPVSELFLYRVNSALKTQNAKECYKGSSDDPIWCKMTCLNVWWKFQTSTTNGVWVMAIWKISRGGNSCDRIIQML